MDQLLSYFLILGAVTALFSLRCWRFVDDAAAEGGSRVGSLDGIRGYLALSVMLHHAVIARHWMQTGVWLPPANPFYPLLGSVAVSLFFMITGYLFWGKLVAKGGRLNWTALYIGRLFRIAPVYGLAIVCMLFVVTVRSGWALHEPAMAVLREVLHWFGLGLLPGLDVNQVPQTALILAGVVWTLSYEWKFYFALLPLSVVAQGRWHLVVAALLLCASIVGTIIASHGIWHFTVLFAVGMMTASLREAGLRFRVAEWLLSALALIALAGPWIVHTGPYSIGQSLPLAVFFFLVCNGAAMFGLFNARPAVRLGHVSYSIYLLHGFVFSVGFDNALMRNMLVSGNVLYFWLITGGGALVLCIVASIVYATIERPCIEYGRSVGSRMTFRTGLQVAASS
ncbi:acyltransferase family protein [Trinickia fusca]|uniref:Acyltransferase n=1 Tax=Trinickia fusca TaxID=2419777 RepID=A0A494XTI5_9BURK|nr:acyltransferase [Trinickia fusca]RKP50843.1 acyltransferase [Trinickia fusca]